MAPVDVEAIHDVFQLFAVSCADGGEPYIPLCLVAAASREAGYYPTSSALHHFEKTMPSAAAGAVTFPSFLQFCEDVAQASRPGRSTIYTMVDDIDPRGSGIISRRELFLALTSGSATISDGEIDAIMEMLDPANCGYIRLNDLAAVLIKACAPPPRSRSRSRSPTAQQHHQQDNAPARPKASRQGHPQASRNTAAGEGARSPAPAPQQPQRAEAGGLARRPHAERSSVPPEDPPPHRQHRRRGFQRCRPASQPHPATATATATTSAAAAPVVDGAPGLRSSSAGAGDRERSFKRTDVGTNGEVVFRPGASLYQRQETFERTQTAMTVDVDVQPSTHQTTTATAAGRRRGFARSASAASSPAVQTPSRPPRPIATATTDAETPPGEHPIDAESGTLRCDGDSEGLQEYSRLEPVARARGTSTVCAPSATATSAAAVPPRTTPPKQETPAKCCAML